jgi:hypothetical protein
MSESESLDEGTRLLPAVPPRNYVYADELVGNKNYIFNNKENQSFFNMDLVFFILESNP